MGVIFYIILFFIGYLVIGGIIIQIFSFFKGLFCGRDIVRKDDYGETAENIGDTLRSVISDKLDERRAVLLGFFGKAKEIISSFALVDTPN